MNKLKKHTKKVMITLAGTLVLVGGLVMLITPGPGWLFIILGLGILATEYVWAHHLLEKAKEYYEKSKEKALKKIKKKS